MSKHNIGITVKISLPEHLWDQFVSGDHSCFCNLFKGYYKALYGYGLKLSNDSALVEDSVQNLFITVWERRDDLKHITCPNVYLFVSLRRAILKARRKKEKESKGLKENAYQDFDIVFTEEELIINRESKKQQIKELNKALNLLSNQQKEVLYLHYYNGMSYGEIENILSISRQSVRNHVYRAMEVLRTILDKDIMKLVVSVLIVLLLPV